MVRGWLDGGQGVVHGSSVVVWQWPGDVLMVVQRWFDGLRIRNSNLNSKNDFRNLKMKSYSETKEVFFFFFVKPKIFYVILIFLVKPNTKKYKKIFYAEINGVLIYVWVSFTTLNISKLIIAIIMRNSIVIKVIHNFHNLRAKKKKKK
jgi:hypothetical protein